MIISRSHAPRSRAWFSPYRCTTWMSDGRWFRTIKKGITQWRRYYINPKCAMPTAYLNEPPPPPCSHGHVAPRPDLGSSSATPMLIYNPTPPASPHRKEERRPSCLQKPLNPLTLKTLKSQHPKSNRKVDRATYLKHPSKLAIVGNGDSDLGSPRHANHRRE